MVFNILNTLQYISHLKFHLIRFNPILTKGRKIEMKRNTVNMTLTPSSAAAGGVFSRLKSSFTVGQMRQSVEDYTEGSLMLQYNKFRAL